MTISIIGAIATIVTIGSFLFNNIQKIRLVNFVGCLIWLLYGALNVDLPIIVVNGAIALIHIYSFIKAEQDHDDSMGK